MRGRIQRRFDEKKHGNREQRDNADQTDKAFHILVRPPQV